jgi:hypothetical protein
MIGYFHFDKYNEGYPYKQKKGEGHQGMPQKFILLKNSRAAPPVVASMHGIECMQRPYYS